MVNNPILFFSELPFNHGTSVSHIKIFPIIKTFLEGKSFSCLHYDMGSKLKDLGVIYIKEIEENKVFFFMERSYLIKNDIFNLETLAKTDDALYTVFRDLLFLRDALEDTKKIIEDIRTGHNTTFKYNMIETLKFKTLYPDLAKNPITAKRKKHL